MALIRSTFALLAITLASLTITQVQDPLPSWNESPTKKSITEFIVNVTKEGSPDLVPPAERIATFDNDGTLWAERGIHPASTNE